MITLRVGSVRKARSKNRKWNYGFSLWYSYSSTLKKSPTKFFLNKNNFSGSQVPGKPKVLFLNFLHKYQNFWMKLGLVSKPLYSKMIMKNNFDLFWLYWRPDYDKRLKLFSENQNFQNCIFCPNKTCSRVWK